MQKTNLIARIRQTTAAPWADVTAAAPEETHRLERMHPDYRVDVGACDPFTMTQSEPNRTVEQYHEMADKVGLIPNVRKKDNVIQGIVVGTTTVVGVAAGAIVEGTTEGALIGALAGLVVGGFVSGLALMVVGLLRRS